MGSNNRIAAAALALALGLVSGATAQDHAVKVTEARKGLFKLAKVSSADAEKTALGRYPAGQIKRGELERENGRLIYSFEIQQPGVTGKEEVDVDAASGAVLKTEHETPAPPKAAPAAKPMSKPMAKKPAKP
ncbi:MAG TPA: PepSY domain-containing protein [Gemmatimonadales bacterium]